MAASARPGRRREPDEPPHPMTRVVSGAVLGAAALAAVLYLPLPGLRVLACVVALLAAHEYLPLVRTGAGRERLLPLALVVVTCWWSSVAPTGGTLLVLVLLMLVAVAAETLMWEVSFERIVAAFFPAWYIGLPLGLLVALHAAGGYRATVLLLATVVVSDSGQYYTGRALGRRPLAPRISPKKTLEGAVGGVLIGTGFVTLAGGWAVPTASWASLAALGAVLVVVGICGDLFESRLKRSAGIKDSSSLIPGHGGVLDRIDALLFAAPAFYVYLRWVA